MGLWLGMVREEVGESEPKNAGEKEMEKNIYSNPLSERYASKEMLENFSPQNKFSSWRKLWIALAEGEKELGLNITNAQIEAIKKKKMI